MHYQFLPSPIHSADQQLHGKLPDHVPAQRCAPENLASSMTPDQEIKVAWRNTIPRPDRTHIVQREGFPLCNILHHVQ